MAITISGVLVLIILLVLFMTLPQFGKLPSGRRLELIKQSANYRNGQFLNLNHTPDLAEGTTYIKVLWAFFFKKGRRSRPEDILPSQKISLLSLGDDENILVWLGHSSYFMKIDGKTILVDPVLSGHASPLPFTTRAFKGADVYIADDFPHIDYLFITHDHWDHMDYKTLRKMMPKIGITITSLGTGAHLERWGYNPAKILEKDWYEKIDLGHGFFTDTVPARHFSGRGFRRNRSIWTSFVLQTPSKKIFIGGDSGYDSHFSIAGKQFGPFDLAILECGQYNESWKYIHMMPEEVVWAAKNLGAKKLLPVHWGKFSLALHDWDEPIIRVSAEAEKQHLPLLTPMIGQKINLDEHINFIKWWEDVD